MVVDDDEIIKVHVHTDHPGKAMEEALAYGMLTKLKVDNMRLQFADKVSNAQKAAKAEAQRGNLPYAAPDPDRLFGFVAVAAGEGVRQLFLDLGVDQVVSGGQTMNPSTDDILSAVQSVGAQTVLCCPTTRTLLWPRNSRSASLTGRSLCSRPRQFRRAFRRCSPLTPSRMPIRTSWRCPAPPACRHRTDYLRCTRQRF